jgi:hypothetical protein
MSILHWIYTHHDALASAATAYNGFILGTAAMVAGVWAFITYKFTRSAEPALALEVSTEKIYLEQGKVMALVTIILENVGKVKIQAKRVRNVRGKDGKTYTFSDGFDNLPFACTLEVRRVLDTSSVRPPSRLAWYGLDGVGFPRIEPEAIDLLEEYYDEKEHVTDFWMEPGESYHAASALVLSPGAYLAKVTFVGKHEDDYWSRIFAFGVGS